MHYIKLREAHFTHEEAHELSRLKRMDYKEIKPMRRERQKLWESFDHESENRGWGKWRRSREWKALIQGWYAAKGFMGKEDKIGGWTFVDKLWKNVWFWFDAESKKLPDEKRYSDDQSSLRKKGPGPHEKQIKAKREADQARNQKWIDDLMRSSARNPERDKQLTQQAQRLGWKGKSLYKASQRKGYV